MVSAASAPDPPMVEPKTMLPVPAVNVRLLFPFTVLENVISPAPDPVEMEVVPCKFTARRKEIS